MHPDHGSCSECGFPLFTRGCQNEECPKYYLRVAAAADNDEEEDDESDDDG